MEKILTFDVSWEASSTNGCRKKYVLRQMQSDSREKSGRLTQLCKMILFSFLRHQITRSRWKGGTRTIGIENVLLSTRQQISQRSASLSPRGTIAIKHENNEFKSHSKSILRSLLLLLQPNNERLLKWSKNNFTCRSLRWCPGPDEEQGKKDFITREPT